MILKILNNPSYLGHRKWKNQLFQNTHAPIISEKQFEETQALLRRLPTSHHSGAFAIEHPGFLGTSTNRPPFMTFELEMQRQSPSYRERSRVDITHLQRGPVTLADPITWSTLPSHFVRPPVIRRSVGRSSYHGRSPIP